MSDGTSTVVPSIQCLSTERTSSTVFIRDSGDFDPVTVREAGAFARLLEYQDFKFFLKLFHNIMPHVDLLNAKLQNLFSASAESAITQPCFQDNLGVVRPEFQASRIDGKGL